MFEASAQRLKWTTVDAVGLCEIVFSDQVVQSCSPTAAGSLSRPNLSHVAAHARVVVCVALFRFFFFIICFPCKRDTECSSLYTTLPVKAPLSLTDCEAAA